MFSVPIKGRSPCYASLHCEENVEHSQRKENVIYRDRSRIVEFLLQLENKQQIMQNNVETQNNSMFSLYIGSLCNIAFLMARFILPLIEILTFDWLRQILYAAILCFLTNSIFLIYPLHVTYWPHITFLNPFRVTLRGILHYDVTQI